MSIAGLGAYRSSYYYASTVTKKRSSSLSNYADSYLQREGKDGEDAKDLVDAAKNAVATSPYCKCIVANIQTEELYASQNDAGEMIYSYQKTEQRFQIFIKSDGHDKTYAVNGYDKDGNPFEKEFRPEDVDPEYADFPEFAALCMFFKYSEETSGLISDDYFDTDDILEKSNYFEKLHSFARGDVMDRAQSMIEHADRLFQDFRQLMNAKDDINTLFEPYYMRFSSMEITYIEQAEGPEALEKLGDAHSSEKIQEESKEDEKVTPLGVGFALAGDMGYGMSASLVTKPGCDDTIVRVKVATGGKDEYVDVNLSEFDPKNATAVEMFAYCEYMDAMGEGIDSKWGSFHALKRVASADGRMDFGSLDNILNEKRDWTGMLKEAETTLRNDKTGETVSASDLLKMLEDSYKLATQKQKNKEDDWRSMSDDEWDKLLAGIDRYIDEFKEWIRELIQAQNENSEEKETVENAEISRLQEVLLTGNTRTGISKTEKVTECVSCKEGESPDKDTIWTVTCFGADGIISNRCQNGEILDSWEIKYKNPQDAQRVWDYLAQFDPDEEVPNSGDMEFWLKFLSYEV